MNNAHRHSFMKREDVIGGAWKLHYLFRNPKTKKVLIGCEVCHPKKQLRPKRNGRIYELEAE